MSGQAVAVVVVEAVMAVLHCMVQKTRESKVVVVAACEHMECSAFSCLS